MRAGSLGVLGLVALGALTACENEYAKTPVDAQGVVGMDDPSSTPAGDATQPSPQSEAQLPAPMWPRRFAVGDTSFATYEPQLDSWTNGRLAGRVAVEAFPRGANAPVYGIAWFEARTNPAASQTPQESVTLDDVHVLRVTFPTAKDREGKYLEALRAVDVAGERTTTVARLQAELAYGAKRESMNAQPIKNDPPRIVMVERPTQLVLVDGAPRWRDENGVQRVLNTRALIVRDGESFYVWVGDRWFRSSTIDGAYRKADTVPTAVGDARKRLEGSSNIELFTDSTERGRQGLDVIVATKPTEIVETRGAPLFEAIPGTKLSFASNTESDVLRDATGTYVLLSGRWFRAPSLHGPWSFVAANQLPSAFRAIPPDHREARVLASISGTTQAEEAVIAASVPQTATIDRSDARLTVTYDGSPQFQPIQGAEPLQYAVNSATPVVGTADGMYYAVEDGVWFVAASPDGPWTVATTVPEGIYTIPVSSPIHYVTYVRVYGYSDDYAYVGYTPGYMGAIDEYGVVVWGTGYSYSPWIGSVWYGWPYTWGFGIGLGVGYGVGFGFGPRFASFGHHHHPWWGPGRFGHPGVDGRGVAGVGRAGVYQRWGAPGVRGAPGPAGYASRSVPAARAAAPPAYGARGGVGAPTTLNSGTYYRGGATRAPAPYYGGTVRGAAPPASVRAAPPSPGFRGAPSGGFHAAPSGGFHGGSVQSVPSGGFHGGGGGGFHGGGGGGFHGGGGGGFHGGGGHR